MNKVWVIFEYQYESNPYYEGPAALCRYKLCTAKEILDEYLVEWTMTYYYQNVAYPYERIKFDGKLAYLCKKGNSLVIIEEKEISTE